MYCGAEHFIFLFLSSVHMYVLQQNNNVQEKHNCNLQNPGKCMTLIINPLAPREQ